MKLSVFNKLFAIIFIGFFSKLSYSQTNSSSGVRIKYYNKTGYHLDSLSIANLFIGRLEDEASTDYLIYESVVTTDGFLSLPRVWAKIGKTYSIDFFNNKPIGYCGNGLGMLKTGSFEYDIKIEADVGEFRLYLDKHIEN